MTLRLEGLTKRYPGTGPPAVDGIDLEIEDGEVLVLIGESGCGKTTTLKMVNRLVEASAGRVWLNGVDTQHQDPVALRRSIGYVFQEAALFPHMTVAANVGVTLELLGWNAERIASRTDELLRLVNLDPDRYGGRSPAELSGGQKQHVGFARALAAGPSLLLLDEPFGALDPLTRDHLQMEFQELQASLGFTAVLVTHDMTEALYLGDRIAVMREGRVVATGTPAELLQQQEAEATPHGSYVEELLATPRRSVERLDGLLRGSDARKMR